MTILVTYGDRRRCSAGLAEMVADGLREEGYPVEVVGTRHARNLDRYEAVIIDGDPYDYRWHHGPSRFVKRHTGALCPRPTYLFSDGSSHPSPDGRDPTLVTEFQAVMDRIGARGLASFGGCPTTGIAGSHASLEASKGSDRTEVRAWTHAVASELRTGMVADA